MPEKSINYDRAADFYDETRGYPDGIAEQIAEFIASKALFKADTSVLEVGVGTGRIALPLAAHVGQYTGVDISLKMMQKLDEKQGDDTVHLAVADGEQLPFAAASFKHVVVSHVLHLVADPQQMLDEIARVLVRPGQLIYLNSFQDLPYKLEKISREWRKHRKQTDKTAFERSRTGELIDPQQWYKMETYRLAYPRMEKPSYFLDAIKNRWHSNMWEMSEPELEVAYLALERVIKEQFGDDADTAVEIASGISIDIYVPTK